MDAGGEGAQHDQGSASRILGREVPLDYSSTLGFFERRAERSGGTPKITVTSYQDQDPDLAVRRDEAEWARAEPLLGLDRNPSVLDVGCGVGRWARHLDGRVSRYLGVDFSPGLLELAEATLDELSLREVARTELRSAADIGSPPLSDPGPFELVIISGVLIYLNDDDVRRCLEGVASLAASNAVVYVREPVAVDQRLTLSTHWSEELADDYHAVYRPAADYRSMLDEILVAAGMTFVHDEPLDAALQNRSDTTQHFFVLEHAHG